VIGGAGFIESNLVVQPNAHDIERIVIAYHFDRSGKWKILIGLCYEDYMDREALLYWRGQRKGFIRAHQVTTTVKE
jgi:hypothetical protein